MSKVHDIPVGEIMSRDMRCVSPNTAIREALDLLAGAPNRTGLPVLTDEGRLLGSISLRDIALAEGQLHENYEVDVRLRKALLGWGGNDVLTEEEALQVERRIDGDVSDCMTPEAYAIEPTWTVGTAARFMVEKNTQRLFVTDRKAVRGVVSTMDLLRLVANGDQ